MGFAPPSLTRLPPVLALCLCAWPSAPANASQLAELPSVLVITKSSNKNQVHYAAVVDESCAPVGPAPIHPYWRMLERSPNATEPLTDAEQRVLGLERQEVGSDAVMITLRGMPARSFTVHLQRGDGGRCSSWVEANIGGTPAHLASFFVQQKLFGAVDHVLLAGATPEGVAVKERVSP